MTACDGMGGKGQTGAKWQYKEILTKTDSICQYVITIHRCIPVTSQLDCKSPVKLGQKESPLEPRKHYWVTNRNKSLCSPLCSTLKFQKRCGKKKFVYHLKDATSAQAVLLPTTFDRRVHPLARWETNNTFFANFDKPFVTGVKSGNVASFRIHPYFAVVNTWWISANIPCKACNMGS